MAWMQERGKYVCFVRSEGIGSLNPTKSFCSMKISWTHLSIHMYHVPGLIWLLDMILRDVRMSSISHELVFMDIVSNACSQLRKRSKDGMSKERVGPSDA